MFDSDTIILKYLKPKDFSLSLNLVNIYYKGYHTICEGHYLLGVIKLHINKYKMTTNTYLLDDMQHVSIYEIKNLISKLYLIHDHKQSIYD